MKHSNREEIEEHYQEQLEVERQARRDRAPRIDEPRDIEEVPRRSFWRTGCCAIIILVMLAALGLIYYVYVNIHDEVEAELQKAPSKIENIKGEADAAIEEGQDIYQKAVETKEKIDEVKDKIDNLNEQVDSITNALQ
jgi:predicted negative regulator of RcsB-dependent stress response